MLVPVASIGSTTITREPSGNLSGNLRNGRKELQSLPQSAVAKRYKIIQAQIREETEQQCVLIVRKHTIFHTET